MTARVYQIGVNILKKEIITPSRKLAHPNTLVPTVCIGPIMATALEGLIGHTKYEPS